MNPLIKQIKHQFLENLEIKEMKQIKSEVWKKSKWNLEMKKKKNIFIKIREFTLKTFNK